MNMWRLAEFFGPIKSANNALLFPQENGTKNSEQQTGRRQEIELGSENWIVEYVFDQTVPCTLNSFIGIGGLGGKGRWKNERTDRVHVEVDIECDKQKLEGQTSTYLGMFRCNTLQPLWPCGIHNAGYHDVQIRNSDLKPFMYLELRPLAIPCNSIISLWQQC